MPVIDQAIFDELKDLSGEDFLNDLIDAFLEDAPHMLRNMHTALAAKETQSLRLNAHSLKSNANTFGATELAMLAKELEFMARENNLDTGNRMKVLEEAYARVADALRELRS